MLTSNVFWGAIAIGVIVVICGGFAFAVKCAYDIYGILTEVKEDDEQDGIY